MYSQSPRVELSITLGNHPTVFQAEVQAIWTCAMLNIATGYKGKHISICSDSQAAMRAIGSYVTTSRLVLKCSETLDELSQEKHVKLLWVPGHSVICGNERANTLAQEGAAGKGVPLSQNIGYAPGHIRKAVGSWATEQTNRVLRETPRLKHFKTIMGVPGPAWVGGCCTLDRGDMRLAVSLLTGHWHTKKHLHGMGLGEGSTCRWCESEEETSLHLITDCERVVILRLRYIPRS